MNQETTATHLDQRSNLYDKVKSAPQASIYTDLHFATSGNAQRSPDEGQLSFAESKDATAKSTQAAPEGDLQSFSPVLYDSPAESDSDESMKKNVENVTPPETPPQVESPGATAAIGRLSLDSVDPDNRSRCQRGRGFGSGRNVGPSKRAASTEMPGRPSPSSCHRDVKGRDAPFDSKDPARHVQRQARNQHGPRLSSGARCTGALRANTRMPARGRQYGLKPIQPLPRDSGYDTMPSSRQNTGRATELNTLAECTPLRQCLPVDQPKGVVTRLAGPVPVLIDSRFPKLIMQPESSPISQDQLAAEVKGIYGGLVMVESKCISIDAAQAADPNSQLGTEQWQALIALHRTLLYEHHDFLMATQHPSATPALSGLAQKYSMPARMWRHGIHAFLEVLRHRRPQSQDYMLAFIYLAYQMMALLFETVPAFTDTWIECLGDLARYRMAIEEDRETHSIWGGVAARWYNMASDRHPSIGRLYHHLGILERPSLRKMFLYAKSLTCVIPFPNARDSLATLCGPIVQDAQTALQGLAPFEAAAVSFNAHVFGGQDQTALPELSSTVTSQLSQLSTSKLKDISVPLLVAHIATLFEHGNASNQLWARFSHSINTSIQSSRPSATAFPSSNKGFESQADPWPIKGTVADELVYESCYSLFQKILHRGTERQSLQDILPGVHTILVWLHSVCAVQSDANDDTFSSLLDRFDWGALCDFLNTLTQYEPVSEQTEALVKAGSFPMSQDADARPLSEDFLIRGLIWCNDYFPADWFRNQTEDDGRFFESPAMHKDRVIRVQYLSLLLAIRSDQFAFDTSVQQFRLATGQSPSNSSASEVYVWPEAQKNDRGYSEERRRAPTPKSRSSTTISAHSDSEGYTVINTHKAKMSYSEAASGGYSDARIVDDDHDMEYGF